MTEDLQKIETHLKELKMPERIDFDPASYTPLPEKFFKAHFNYLRAAGSDNFKKPYEDRVRFAYQVVLEHNNL